MKGKYIAIFAVLGIIIFFFSMEARSVDWVFYVTAADGNNYYYDSQSIKWVSKDIVQVWEKTVYTEKGVPDMIKKYGPEYKELSCGIGLFEFNCSEKKSRGLSLTYHNHHGSVIYSAPRDSSWDFIIPESVSESLFNIVCGGR